MTDFFSCLIYTHSLCLRGFGLHESLFELLFSEERMYPPFTVLSWLGIIFGDVMTTSTLFCLHRWLLPALPSQYLGKSLEIKLHGLRVFFLIGQSCVS